MAMSRSFGGTSLTRLVPMRISPPEISSRPAIMRSSVDLPQPDGPTSTVKEPSVMSMSTPCRTAVSPKLFLTPWIVTLAICAAGGRAGPTELGGNALMARSIGRHPTRRHEGKPVEPRRPGFV
jgi:hypothetical protein